MFKFAGDSVPPVGWMCVRKEGRKEKFQSEPANGWSGGASRCLEGERFGEYGGMVVEIKR